MSEKLLPCPFCGGHAEFSVGKTGDGKDWHYIECEKCGAIGPRVEYADHQIQVKQANAEAWNGREPEPSSNGDGRAEEPVVLRFGKGELVVGTATSPVAPDAHLVVINPALLPGPVGEITHDREKRDTFVGDEVVLVFDSFEQARRVADALCNVPLDQSREAAR